MLCSRVSMLLLLTLAARAIADPLCDDETQYLHNGECCQLCEPGTSMVSMGVCRTPVCKDCEADEYMNKYNKESVCKRQPYCHPNSNFVLRPEVTSTKAAHKCQCKEGFHCSGVFCDTCVAHTECGPGYGATTIGDQTHDTVCEKCPEGTFSGVKSWNGVCREKTKCLDGLEEPIGGSSISDNECVPKHLHTGLIAIPVVIVLAVIVAALVYIHKCKGKTGHEPKQYQPEAPNNDYDKVPVKEEEKEELKFPFQETCHTVPEETEDVTRTENGELLSQDGKEYVISQPETQTNHASELLHVLSEN